MHNLIFIILKWGMNDNFYKKKDQQKNTPCVLKTQLPDQEQQYIKKIQYQVHKFTAFYNYSTIPTKKQNEQLFLYTSEIHIQTLSQLILSIHEILSIEAKRNEMMLPALTHTWTLIGSQLRLGLQSGNVNHVQVLQKQYVNQTQSLSSHRQIKSVQIQKKAKTKFYKTNFNYVRRWLMSKLFKKSHQTYILVMHPNQQKSISFFDDQTIDFIQISPHQYLFYPKSTLADQHTEKQLKQWFFFQTLFGSLFEQNSNITVDILYQQKIREILDLLSQYSQQGQDCKKIKYYDISSTKNNVRITISKQKLLNVREFLVESLGKTFIHKNRQIQSQCSKFQHLDKPTNDNYKHKKPNQKAFAQQPDLNTFFQTAIQELRGNGLASLVKVWKYVIKPKIQDIHNNFQVYQQDFKDHLLLFCRLHQLNQLKIQIYLKKDILKYPLNQKKQIKIIYETIFPNIMKIIQLTLQKLGGQKLRFYLSNFKQQNKTQGLSQHQLEAQFVSIISRELSCAESIQTQKLFLQRIKQFIDDFENPSKNKSQPALSSENYFGNIENERITNNPCLGCATFLYQFMNIQQPTIQQTPLKIYKDVNILKENHAEFIENVCAMLNSGGGVILFGFKQQHGQYKTFGRMMSEKEKQAIEHRISAVFNLIYPTIQQKDWDFSFVPVHESPLLSNKNTQKKNQSSLKVPYKGIQQSFKPNQYYIERPPLKGVYVSRLIIKPCDNSKFYIYSFKKQKSNETLYANSFENGSLKQIPFRSVRKIIKQKVKAYYIPEQLRQYQTTFLKRNGIFDHECFSPEAGQRFSENKPVFVNSLFKKQSSVQFSFGCASSKEGKKNIQNKQVFL